MMLVACTDENTTGFTLNGVSDLHHHFQIWHFNYEHIDIDNEALLGLMLPSALQVLV
jgi:hypothetical protein